MTYAEQLRHPKWQKKRLEILNLHGFRCQECKSENNTLHVHHGIYIKGRKVWEYPEPTLHVLCETCHSNHEIIRSEINEHLSTMELVNLECVNSILMAAVQSGDLQAALNSFCFLFCIDDATRLIFCELLEKASDNGISAA